MTDNAPQQDAPKRPKTVDGQPLFTHLLASNPESQNRSGAFATFTSLVLHVAVIAGVVYVTQKLQDAPKDDADEQVTLFEIPEEPAEEPPPPPPPPPPPDQPPPPTPTTTDVPKGFQTLAPPDIVPPDIPLPTTGPELSEADFSGEGVVGGKADGRVVTAEDLAKAPVFTPYTVAPDLKNRDEVSRALVRHYPPLLRDAGIGGTVQVWFFIDEAGNVQSTRINTSSGQKALDEAALKVADVMKFTPALNRDQKVKVWVAIPIVFTAK